MKRIGRAEFNVFTSSTDKDRKAAHEKKYLLTSYGAFCFFYRF